MSLLRAGVRCLLPKVGARLFSNRLALVVAAGTEGMRTIEPGVELVVRREPSAQLLEIPATLQQAVGEDFLFLRGLERMRLHDPGDAFVARLPSGDIVASLFVHDVPARDRLEQMQPGMYPPIAPDEPLTEGVYCWPRFRGRGVVSHLLVTTLRMLRDSGVVRALAVIDPTNVASLRAFGRAGYAPTGVVRYGAYRLNRWNSVFVDDPATAERVWLQVFGEPDRPRRPFETRSIEAFDRREARCAKPVS